MDREREKKSREPELDWENETVFKDVVLGYIGVPKAVVDKLIDHKIFQRLHDVAQTGMETLYPGATHNRFCHSVGVYHLGKLAFQSFQKNVKNQHGDDIYYGVAGTVVACERVWNRWRFLFEMACLLHDCGHSPLSHSLEFLYDSNERMPSGINRQYRSSDQLLLEMFEGNADFCDHFYNKEVTRQHKSAYGAPHERMSGYLIMHKEGYRYALQELIRDQLLHFNAVSQRGRGDESAGVIYDESMLQSDLEFMVRAVIGYPYGEQSRFWGEEDLHRETVIQVRNCIIRLLNGIIDVDNIDYSIRDASASGYKSSQVDYERLLKAETIALAYEHQDPELRLDGAPFDYLVRLYRFQSDPVKGEPLCMTISGSATLRVDWTPNGRGYAGQETGGLLISGEIIEDDQECSEKNVRVIHIKPGSSAHIVLNCGSLTITPRSQAGEFTPMYIRSGSLRGRLSGMVFVGSGHIHSRTDEEQVLLDSIKRGKVRLFPAYHKSALSVLQGALDAANFESKWIYSHHITTYRNNFLSVFLLEKFSDYQFEQEYSGLFLHLEQYFELAPKFLDVREAPYGRWGLTRLRGFFNRQRPLDAPGPAQGSPRSVQGELDNITKSVKEYPKLADIAEELPTSVSGFRTEEGREVCGTLVHALHVLLRGLVSIDFTSTVAERLKNGLLWWIKHISGFLRSPPQPAAQGPSDVERRIFADLTEQIRSCEGHSIGMGTMSALLGMPDRVRVNGRTFYRSSDSDLQSMYHSLVQNATKEQKRTYQDLFLAIEQYESRQYLVPMWKSHAEFHFYTHGWKKKWFQPEDPKSSNPCSLIQEFFDSNNMPVSQYTYFSDSAVQAYSPALKEFWTTVKDRFHLDVLVYVPQQIRNKALPENDTYVVWKNRIVTLQDIGIAARKVDRNSYFYLYYRRTEDARGEDELDVCDFMDFLKEILSKRELTPEDSPGAASRP